MYIEVMKDRKKPPLKGWDRLNPNLEGGSKPVQKMELKNPGLKPGVPPNLMKTMKKIHLLPNVVTAFALSCGLFVIFKINMISPGEATIQALTSTAGILLLAVFADLLDGTIARAIKAESDFGGLFDSMADSITFGVAPAVIVLKTFSVLPGTLLSFFLTMAAMVYSVCGVLRLVRFSLASQVAKGDLEQIAANKKNFTGLPIPAAAGAAVSTNLLLMSDEFKTYVSLSEETAPWILFFVMSMLGYLMISRWKFPSLKSLQLRVASFQLVFLTVLSAVIIFYGILHHFAVIFFFGSWFYIIVALILSLIRMVRGRKSKTLEDFEPEPDDLEWEEEDK
ncbi:MAG TPA: phosphatidylcholine/phosphatidylserine synthase [Waddliaceae bacterium]